MDFEASAWDFEASVWDLTLEYSINDRCRIKGVWAAANDLVDINFLTVVKTSKSPGEPTATANCLDLNFQNYSDCDVLLVQCSLAYSPGTNCGCLMDAKNFRFMRQFCP
jgi:hypothetical protein